MCGGEVLGQCALTLVSEHTAGNENPTLKLLFVYLK